MKLTYCWPPYLKVGGHISIDDNCTALSLSLMPLFSLDIEVYYGWLKGVAVELGLFSCFLELDGTNYASKEEVGRDCC